MLGIFMMLSESAVPGAVPPLTLINYIVDASGLTELNWPSLDLPVVGQVGGWAFLNSFPQYTPSDDLSIVTALSQPRRQRAQRSTSGERRPRLLGARNVADPSACLRGGRAS